MPPLQPMRLTRCRGGIYPAQTENSPCHPEQRAKRISCVIPSEAPSLPRRSLQGEAGGAPTRDLWKSSWERTPEDHPPDSSSSDSSE